MSSMDVSIHWFIARDGRQHGPVSDMEMRKLVELGHLRHTDLLWRQGFPDWRPAPTVFAGSPAAATAPGAGAASMAADRLHAMQAERGASERHHASTSHSVMPRFEATAGRGAMSGAAATAAAAAMSNGAAIGQSLPQPSGQPYPGGPQVASAQPGLQLSSIGERQPLSTNPSNGAQFIPQAREPRLESGPSSDFRESLPAANRGDGPPARSKRKLAIAASVALLALAGGGWYATKFMGVDFKNLIAFKKNDVKPADSAPAVSTPAEAPEQKAPEVATVALAAPSPGQVQAIEANLQKAPYWKLIATEFPDWYREKVDAAARLATEGKSETEVAKNLVQAIVELRRSQSEAALAASSPTLKALASAFKATVTRLSKEGTATCMGFIMAGESHDSVVAMIADPARNTEVNAHLLAIFSAVVEGRKSATVHADPADGDYKLLVAELVKGGWTQAELEIFADPKGASRTTPERYCQMMQDFFAAHLTIPDAAVQDRLLHRTLKLVVAG